MKPPSSVLLLNDAADPRAAEESRRLYQWLETRGVRVESSSEFDRKVLEQARPELIVVLGGDGTFLRALHGCDDCQVPFLGVRLGTFGYLAELEPDSWEPELQRLLDGHGRIEQWMRLECRVREGAEPGSLAGLAVNEVVLTAAEVARMLDVVLRIDGEDITRFRGDGVIVATPVGSTAHSLAAGGPIVEPTDRCLIFTPLASQAMTYRPLILRPTRTVELAVIEARHGTSVTIDGGPARPLPTGSVVEIRASDHDVRVASIVDRSRFRTLRERLHWGSPLIEPGSPP